VRRVLTASLLAAGLLGCQRDAAPPPSDGSDSRPAAPGTNETSVPTGFTHVIAVETDYYVDGPQQGRPPDGRFTAGTRMRVLQEAGSYVLVRSPDGIEAYVSTDALQRTDSP
jgi:hypothetical protein